MRGMRSTRFPCPCHLCGSEWYPECHTRKKARVGMLLTYHGIVKSPVSIFDTHGKHSMSDDADECGNEPTVSTWFMRHPPHGRGVGRRVIRWQRPHRERCENGRPERRRGLGRRVGKFSGRRNRDARHGRAVGQHARAHLHDFGWHHRSPGLVKCRVRLARKTV